MSLNKFRTVLFLVFLFSCFLVTKTNALAGASFSLSPSSGICIPGGVFDLDIVLTTDEPSSGATAIINYDSSILEAQSLTNGTIFPQELINSINPSGGKIRLDAGVNVANPNFFSGEGVFGTIRFRAAVTGEASISFDFTLGSTKDCNVAHADTHQDILTSVTNGSYTIRGDNTDPSLDPSCVSGAPTPTPTPTLPPGVTPTPTPTSPPTETTPTPTPIFPGVGPTPTPTPTAVGGARTTPTPAAPPADGGGAPEGGISGPTIFLSLLSLLMIGVGLIL